MPWPSHLLVLVTLTTTLSLVTMSDVEPSDPAFPRTPSFVTPIAH